MAKKSPQNNGPQGHEEDITPVDTLPAEPQLPASKPAPGWQTKPLPDEQIKLPCPHFGQVRASLQAHKYPLGAEWVCGCGQIFVVAYTAGDKRTLRLKERVVDAAPVVE